MPQDMPYMDPNLSTLGPAALGTQSLGSIMSGGGVAANPIYTPTLQYPMRPQEPDLSGIGGLVQLIAGMRMQQQAQEIRQREYGSAVDYVEKTGMQDAWGGADKFRGAIADYYNMGGKTEGFANMMEHFKLQQMEKKFIQDQKAQAEAYDSKDIETARQAMDPTDPEMQAEAYDEMKNWDPKKRAGVRASVNAEHMERINKIKESMLRVRAQYQGPLYAARLQEMQNAVASQVNPETGLPWTWSEKQDYVERKEKDLADYKESLQEKIKSSPTYKEKFGGNKTETYKAPLNYDQQTAANELQQQPDADSMYKIARTKYHLKVRQPSVSAGEIGPGGLQQYFKNAILPQLKNQAVANAKSNAPDNLDNDPDIKDAKKHVGDPKAIEIVKAAYKAGKISSEAKYKKLLQILGANDGSI